MSLLLAAQGTPTTTLALDCEIPVDSQAAPAVAITRSETIPVESGVRIQQRNDTIPVESGIRLLNGVAITVEDGIVSSRGEVIPVDSGMSLVRNEEIPVDNIAGAQSTLVPFRTSAEYGADIVYGAREYGAAEFPLVRDEDIPIDSLEAQGVLTRDEQIPIDSAGLLVRTDDIPVEALLTVDIGGSIPIESRMSLVRNEEIPVDNIAGAQSTLVPFRTSAEYGADIVYGAREYGAAEFPLVRDEDIPIETGGLLIRDEDIPVEQFPNVITLTRDEEIPIEALAALVRDEEIPIDNTAQPVFLIVRDEEIPVESLSQTLPFSFITFLGGAGAPWPPSWLTRPTLLADERHCGSIRFYGRSRQVIRRPRAPLPLVIGKPYRPKPALRPAVVQATLVTRQLSECMTFIGGKSTQKIGHDWKMIREADEREIMTIIQVL